MMFLRDLVMDRIAIMIGSKNEWESFNKFCHNFFNYDTYKHCIPLIHHPPFYIYTTNPHRLESQLPIFKERSLPEPGFFEKRKIVSVEEAWSQVNSDIAKIKKGTLLITDEDTVYTSPSSVCKFQGISAVPIDENSGYYLYACRFFGEEY